MGNEVNAFRAFIGVIEVERRRYDLIAHRQYAENCLNCACTPKQVADCRFGGAHRHGADSIAEQALDRAELDGVGHRRCPVCVDIIDVGGLHASALQRHFHCAKCAAAFRMRGCYVIGIAREAVADNLGIDFRAACLGMLIFFKHNNTSTFAHDKAVAILVVRTRSLFRFIIIFCAQRTGLRKSGNTDRTNGRFRAARQHNIGIVERDHPRRIANRVRAGRTGSDHRVVRTHQPVFDADLPGNQVDQPAVDEMRGNAAGALFGQ